LPFNTVLWGQNYGFDLSTSGYRLGGSHQQIHQQFALVRTDMPVYVGGENETSSYSIPTYAQGDRIAQFTKAYQEKTGQGFFKTYLRAIQSNKRLDGHTDKANDLTIYQDENVVVFVPKAQRAQGEIQIISKVECGNIVEAPTGVRHSLDRAILLTMKILENLGVEIFNAFEISKRLDNSDKDQRLLYCFFPRHPQSPGGFSEFQQRWINNHYPEDFAKTCRDELSKIMEPY
jgi:galactose-1-phosphate uridylyltransferase